MRFQGRRGRNLLYVKENQILAQTLLGRWGVVFLLYAGRRRRRDGIGYYTAVYLQTC
jgi:hypothetical protein